jgi:flagellar motility protein MotE (MotC chaperone)
MMRVKGWAAGIARALVMASSICLEVSAPAVAAPDTPEAAAASTKPLDLRAAPKKVVPMMPVRGARPAPPTKVAVKKRAHAASAGNAAATHHNDIPKLVLREPPPQKAPAAESLAGVSESAVKAEAPKSASAPDAKSSSMTAAVAQFCNALSPAASDGRLAWQAGRIEELEGRLRDRIAELEGKRAETADWLRRREEAMKMADDAVVAIYSKMKPDAAAAQFSAMDESGAAAILIKLNPRAASTVLNEIEAGRAARIAAEMAGVGMRRDVGRSIP